MSLETLPAWGCLLGGELYELPMPGPRTVASASSSWLLPTPTVVDMGSNKTPEEWTTWTDEMKARHGNGNGHGRSLTQEALRLLPTPTAQGDGSGQCRDWGGGHEARADVFGVFWPAVERWEWITGRPAPDPVVDRSLSPAFVEWMMGLPEGHVTGHGLKPAACLKMLGNGVVPQQAALALRLLGVGA